MEVKTLEDVRRVVLFITKMLGVHDGMLEEVAEVRATYELGRGIGFAALGHSEDEIKNRLKQKEAALKMYQKRVLEVSRTSSIDKLRDKLSLLSVIFDLLADMRAREVSNGFMLSLFEDTNTKPRDLPSGVEYDAEMEYAELEEVHKRYTDALAKIVDVAKEIAPSDTGMIEVVPAII